MLTPRCRGTPGNRRSVTDSSGIGVYRSGSHGQQSCVAPSPCVGSGPIVNPPATPPESSSAEPLQRIVVLNPKGGSGKTTIATNLASHYAVAGFKPTLMDFDPQGSSTRWVRKRRSENP